MSLHKSIMGRGLGWGTDKTLADYLRRKTQTEALDAVAEEKIDWSLLDKAKKEMDNYDYPNACGYFEEFTTQIKKVYQK